jgi:hypothetical protein
MIASSGDYLRKHLCWLIALIPHERQAMAGGLPVLNVLLNA